MAANFDLGPTGAMEASLLDRRISAARGELENLCQELVRIPSENPPGDTTQIAAMVERFLDEIPGVTVRRVVGKDLVVNLIAKLRGGRAGRRLLLNGHLDTFPAASGTWVHGQFSGQVRDGKLYGRGACDMKAGLAAAMMTAKLLSSSRHELAGELVLHFVSDEETGGTWGTQFVLREPEERGDAMLSADAGSPWVVRFGEKGQLWLEITSTGKSNHGAHVHLGDNAIVSLLGALEALRPLESLPVAIPAAVRSEMERAKPVSERISGAGEFDTLCRVTVNIGTIQGGVAVNIIPDTAVARADIRFPPGIVLRDLMREVERILADWPQVTCKVLTAHEANVTDPGEEIVDSVVRAARKVMGPGVVANMRPGFSDCRFYRSARIPSVVYGPAPNNMGGVDEYVVLDDLFSVFRVHVLVAADFLRPQGPASAAAQ
jgi:succinyl-diaminopimelate desuccinylase